MDSDFTTLISNIQQIQIFRYFNVAIFTTFIAEYFHTSATEINSLWPAPWTVVKILFLISRYSPFLDGPITLALNFLSTPSVGVCTHLMKVQLWSSGLGQTVSQVLLFYRAYALVGRTRLSAILLSLFALGMIILSLALTAVVQKNIEATGGNVPSIFPKCFVSDTGITTNSIVVAAPIGLIVFDSTLFAVISWARVKKYKEERNWLVRKIYRDAFRYYLLLFVVSASGLVVWFSTAGPIRGLSATIPRYLVTIISTRVILNIRQYANVQRTSAETGLTGVGDETTQPASGLRFANHSQTISAVDTELRLY